jgi:hypothetical protein
MVEKQPQQALEVVFRAIDILRTQLDALHAVPDRNAVAEVAMLDAIMRLVREVDVIARSHPRPASGSKSLRD